MSRFSAALISIFSLSALFHSVPVAAQSPAAKVAAVLARPSFKNASVGVLVRSLKTGKTVFAQNPDLALIPASNQKIVTSLTALKTLGATFTYRTVLLTDAVPDTSGTLTGNLYLRGSGDPSLSSARLDELAQSVAKRGIKRVVGRIVGDGSAFDDAALGAGWQWDDEPFYYSAQVSGLNCDENVVAVSVAPGAKEGDAPLVTVNGKPSGEETYLVVERNVRTVAAGAKGAANVLFNRVRGQNRVLVSGTIPVGAKPESEDITIEDPARFTASRFVLALVTAGVAVDTPLWVEPGTTPAGATELAAVESKPLNELLKDFLKPSDNLYGEALLKTVGAKQNSGKPGSTAGGAVAVIALLKNAGIGTGGLHIADGSGLSLQNTVTPRLLCDVLTWAETKLPPADRAVFWNALPVSGTDGTIRNRFKNTPLVGQVRAKTGTLSGASSLSGYLTAKGGERFVFSILMNHYADGASDARAAQDAIVAALYEW